MKMVAENKNLEIVLRYRKNCSWNSYVFYAIVVLGLNFWNLVSVRLCPKKS